MDLSLVLNVTSLLVAIMALAVSAWFAHRQVRVNEQATSVPVILELFERAREPAFISAQEYSRKQLKQEYDPSLGIDGLPLDKTVEVHRVSWFYDDLGKLVAHGLVSEDVVLGAFGYAVMRTWDALAEYVYAERRLRATEYQAYFEHLAARAKARSPIAVHAKLKLEKLRP